MKFIVPCVCVCVCVCVHQGRGWVERCSSVNSVQDIHIEQNHLLLVNIPLDGKCYELISACHVTQIHLTITVESNITYSIILLQISLCARLNMNTNAYKSFLVLFFAYFLIK